MEPVAGGDEHPLGRLQVLALEGAVEGVAEQDHVAMLADHVVRMGGLAAFGPGAAPARKRAPGREARDALGELRQRRHPVAQVQQRRELGGEAGIMRHRADEPILER